MRHYKTAKYCILILDIIRIRYRTFNIKCIYISYKNI